MNTEQAKSALIQTIAAVYDSILAAGPLGAPAGVVFAALMQQGCSIEQYQQIEGIMLRSGLLTKRGDVLTASSPQG